MAETNSKGQRLISIVRIIEYHGTDEWIRATFAASRIPVQGLFEGKLPEGCSIKSGLVVWNVVEEETQAPLEVIPIPSGSRTN